MTGATGGGRGGGGGGGILGGNPRSAEGGGGGGTGGGCIDGAVPVLCRRDFRLSLVSFDRYRRVFRTVLSGIRMPSVSPSSNRNTVS